MAVRNESVRLTLDDAGFSTGMARAAAATAILDRSLDNLDGSTVRAQKSVPGLTRDVDSLGTTSRRSSTDINQLSGRLGLLLRATAAVGPGLVPIAAVGVPAVTGLASQLGFAAIGMGTLVAASQGVGDALKAVNEAALEPTAANLEKAGAAMERLGPDAQAFVTRFQEIRPVLGDIRDAAARGWFPGLTESLDSFEQIAPRVATLFEAIGETGGRLVAEGAAALAGPEWADFISFIQTEAPGALDELGRTVGNVAKGMAELWMAFAPLNASFSSWMLDASRGFASWSEGLSETDGFKEFIDYIRENGPRVADLATSIGDALLQLADAASPLGGPVLEALTGIARAFAAIADSPLGTPILAVAAAMSTASLAARGYQGALTSLNATMARLGGTATTTRGKLMAMGGSLAVVAAGVEGIRIGSDVLDSWNSYRDIGDAAVNTTDDLVRALGKTDLGKYAEEFGIDLQRLGDDLVANGEAGEYYQDVLSRFGESQGTVNRFLDSMTPFQQDSENATRASLALQDVVKEYPEVMGVGATALERASGASETFARRQEQVRVSVAAAKAEARDAATAFIDFSDSVAGEKFSMKGYLDALEAQVAALAKFRDNIDKLRERGLKGTVIDELVRQGPAAAQAVNGLASGSDAAIERMNRAFRKGRGEIRGMGKDAADSKTELASLGDAKVNPYVGMNRQPFDKGKREVKGGITELNGLTAKPKVDANTGQAISSMNAVESRLRSLDGRVATTTIRTRVERFTTRVPFGDALGSADGSTVPKTGLPYADRHPYMLADGEEVISNRNGQADRHRALLKAINANRLADGGTAGIPGLANGGTANMSWRSPGGGIDLPGLRLADMGLKQLGKALRRSEKAMERETRQRDAVADKIASLSSTVTGNLRSDLFSGTNNPWSSSHMGGSFADILATLNKDIATGSGLARNISSLKSKGLDGKALDDLLANATPDQVAMFAGQSASQVAEYERLYKVRESVSARVGAQAGNVAYGKELAVQTRELKAVTNRLERIEATIKAEEKANRQAAKRGAGNASRNRKKS